MAFESELLPLLESRRPALLALGEPTHLEPAFPRLRNEIFEFLVGQGFRSIAIESDRIAGLTANDYVNGDRDELPLATGFSHGLGHLTGNRELITWMRAHNEQLAPADRLSFHGFDAPLEMTSAASPGTSLRHVRDYLGVSAPDLDQLLGDETRWTDQAAIMDAARSPGRSPEAVALRALADDLKTMLYVHASRLVRDTSAQSWHRAKVHADAALGLLRYHAVAADPAPQDERIRRLLGLRDALMAWNLLDIRESERDRGPTLVFSHNRHLQRHPSRWRLAGMDLEWSSAGAIVSSLLGSRYVFVAGSLGTGPTLGLAEPSPDSFEGSLSSGMVPPATAKGSERVTDEPRYFPLDPETLAQCEALLHVAAGDDPAAEVAARVLALPGVAQTRIEPESEMPPYTWGDRFFFAGEDRMRPFATIVGHDIPGFDERSHLNRRFAFRLNIEVGRAEFKNLFGYGPEGFAARIADIDFTEPDRLMPHPAYAVQGWASVVNPGPATADEVERLLSHARTRSAARLAR
ncbi:DUF6194 family protein [Actinoplanes sp. GCM10030250]|uniref:DUF6194 family protein n=1 Tax=Actinoplanes sp. GCM10030250 TaxID=3273376 RepID=UPI00360DFD5F